MLLTALHAVSCEPYLGSSIIHELYICLWSQVLSGSLHLASLQDAHMIVYGSISRAIHRSVHHMVAHNSTSRTITDRCLT